MRLPWCAASHTGPSTFCAPQGGQCQARSGHARKRYCHPGQYSGHGRGACPLAVNPAAAAPRRMPPPLERSRPPPETRNGAAPFCPGRWGHRTSWCAQLLALLRRGALRFSFASAAAPAWEFGSSWGAKDFKRHPYKKTAEHVFSLKPSGSPTPQCNKTYTLKPLKQRAVRADAGPCAGVVEDALAMP